MSTGGGFIAEECFKCVGWIIDGFSGYHAKIESIFQEVDSFFEQAKSKIILLKLRRRRNKSMKI